MRERRKRKSQWDMEEETKQLSRMSENDSWAGMDHHSRHDSGRSRHEFSSSRSFTSPNFRDHSAQPSREPNEGNEIGGGNRYYQNMSPGLDGIERHKYKHSLENDRSDSHRHMRRERSRSRSRSRGRERVRGFSRSRSRSNGSPVGRTRSRSPVGDYRSQTHGWSDQRGLPYNKSDRICRDFPSGRCRRGSQCRFIHSKNSSRGHISKDPYSRVQGSDLRDDVSASGHGEDEQFQNKSRNAVPCREFVKGRCKWGDTCRFSHHLASSHDTFDEGNRYRKPLCKYFVAGKCDQDNCRFSHEDPKFNKPGEVTDAIRISDDDARPARWNESVVKFSNYISGDPSDAKIDNQLGGRTENENISWRIAELGGDMGAAESIDNENRANKQEHLIFHDLPLQNKDVQGQNTLQGDQGFSMTAWEENVSPISPHIQLQDRGVAENNTATSFQSGVLDEVQVLRNPTHAIPFSGQNLNRNGGNVLPLHSSVSNEIDGVVQNVVWPDPSNGFSGGVNWPETQLARSDLHPLMQNHQKAIQMTGVLETKATPVINPTVFPTPRFDNVQQFTEKADTSVLSNSITSAHNPTNVQSYPAVVSCGPFNAVDNERVTSEHHGDYAEQENKMLVKQTSPIPTVDMELDDSKVDNSGSSKLNQETAFANQEADENNRAIGEESKKVENNSKHLENSNGDKKVEESVANKDDKVLRLFKNSLIEFVKDILKPTWKEGRLSRDVHKTIVKKVVDKVTGTIQADHVPKTQEKVDQYLSFSKPKISKLVQAYVERSLKTDS